MENSKVYVGVLGKRIVLLSPEAMFDLIKFGYYWEPKPSDQTINEWINLLERGGQVQIDSQPSSLVRNDPSKKNIMVGLEKAMNGSWKYDYHRDLTTPEHIKKCFQSFCQKDNFDSGKAELLMRVVLYGCIHEVTDVAFLEIKQDKKQEKITNSKSKLVSSSHNSIFNCLHRSITTIIYRTKNEWESKYIGGRILVSKYKNKYKVVAYSTIDDDSITVWVKTGHEVKSAGWNGRKIELSIGMGNMISLWGPNGHKVDIN